MTCEEIDRQVRALLGPYPRAFVTGESGRIPVRGVVPLVSPLSQRRVVRDIDEYLLPFRCADGMVGLIPDSGHESAPSRAAVDGAREAGRERAEPGTVG